MNTEPKPPLRLFSTIQQLQIVLAGIVGSIILVLWVSTWTVVTDVFKDSPKSLSDIRKVIAGMGLFIACFVGINAIIWLVMRILEFKENYAKLLEMKKAKEDGE